MPQIKKGDFCKSKSQFGLIGGLLVVDDVRESLIYVHRIPENGIGSYSKLRSGVKVLKAIHLQISKEDAEHISTKRPDRFTRVSTPKWENAIKDDDYDVAVFVNTAARIKIVVEKPHFWNPYAKTAFKPKKPMVAVRFSNIYVL